MEFLGAFVHDLAMGAIYLVRCPSGTASECRSLKEVYLTIGNRVSRGIRARPRDWKWSF